jgi:hypothetical protein
MAVKLDSGFEILRFSDLDYEGMTTEVQFKGRPIAQLNMDKGRDKMELELFLQTVNQEVVVKFPLRDFLVALEEEQKLLNEY